MLQATLNHAMTEETRTRYWGGVTKAREREEESSTKHGKRLLAGTIAPFSEAIKAWLESMKSKGAGRKGSAFVPLSSLSEDVAAFITLRTVIDGIALKKALSLSAYQIGSQIEDEIRFRWLKSQHPGLFRRLQRQLEHCSSYDHKRTVIVHSMNKNGLSHTTESETWTDSRRMQIGTLLIDLCEKSTGLVVVVSVRQDGKTVNLLQATDQTMEWIDSFHEHNELLDPAWLPMVQPPEPWVRPVAGGYKTDDLPPLNMVKRVSVDQLKVTEAAEMPEVYETLNTLQNTAWKVNHRVKGVMEHFWTVGRGLGGLPRSENEELPVKPVDIATNEDARRDWRNRAARVHAGNAALRSVRIQAKKILNLAQRFANVPAFYFPYQLDFRGRIYATPTFLTPQGSDVARSLLLFAKGCPIQNDYDAYWLGVYGANLFGKDKITFEERLKWVQGERENILAVSKDPLANTWWQEADEPWQFLAWCFEWSGWLTKGPGFMTHLPVCLDGTNNGLQILSMLTLDEVAAKATNVTPSESPADIYGEVALRVIAQMKDEPVAEKKAMAAYWSKFGVDRKTTKRPVMVLPYGGTFHSCRDYVSEWYHEKAKAKQEVLPDNRQVFARVHYLATQIWSGIDFCVGRPRQAMEWLQACANIMTKNQLPIRWTTPTGFPVLQDNKDTKKLFVETALGDRVRKTVIHKPTTKLSASQQRNGISPNFVHSLDASALVKTVARCRRFGIEDFAMIHDSYGTHAPRIHEMAASLRAAFVEIFSVDRLEKLREELQAQLIAAGSTDELPPVPPKGDLDIQQLKESEFFFA